MISKYIILKLANILEIKNNLDRRIYKLEKDILDFMLKYQNKHNKITEELSVKFPLPSFIGKYRPDSVLENLPLMYNL